MNKKVPDSTDRDDEGRAVDGQKAGVVGLLDKIRATLSNTSPERWEQGGEPLDATRRFPRARTAWEQVFYTDTKSGVLVLRCSTPLTSNFFAGGYSFAPAASPRFTIELRGRGWSPKALLDPSFRGAGGTEASLQVLAEGDIAQQLYQEIDSIVKQYRESLRRDFNDAVARLSGNIKEYIGETTAADWQVVDGEGSARGYRTEINNLVVTIACSKTDVSTQYFLSVTRYGLVWQCRDPFMMQEAFQMVDESVKAASLEQLGKVLDDML